MKKLVMSILCGLMAMIMISCGKTSSRDPMVLVAEIDNSTPNVLTKSEKQNGWQLLFDGKSTGGWHGYNMSGFPDSWAIEDEAFTMNSKGGAEDLDIITNKKYGSFALSLEYKLTKGANSGIIYQVAEDTMYKFPYETGPEFQVIDHQNWPDTLEDWQINGANYAMYPPAEKPYKELGEWNHLFLEVDSNRVTQILNGVVVVKYEKNSPEWTTLRNSGKWTDYPDWGKFDEGHISLQNHGTKVWYRSIKLKEI